MTCKTIFFERFAKNWHKRNWTSNILTFFSLLFKNISQSIQKWSGCNTKLSRQSITRRSLVWKIENHAWNIISTVWEEKKSFVSNDWFMYLQFELYLAYIIFCSILLFYYQESTIHLILMEVCYFSFFFLLHLLRYRQTIDL